MRKLPLFGKAFEIKIDFEWPRIDELDNSLPHDKAVKLVGLDYALDTQWNFLSYL